MSSRKLTLPLNQLPGNNLHAFLTKIFTLSIRVDRNSRTGIAMWTVEEILDRFNNPLGRSMFIEPDISRMQAVKATIQNW